MPLKQQSKTWTIEDLIAIHEADLKRTGLAYCKVLDKLYEMRETWDIPAFEKWIFTQETEGPEYAYLGIRNARIYDNDKVADHLQEYYAEALEQMKFPTALVFTEKLLGHHTDLNISKPAVKILHRIIDKRHKNPKAFRSLELAHPLPYASK